MGNGFGNKTTEGEGRTHALGILQKFQKVHAWWGSTQRRRKVNTNQGVELL